MILALRLFFLVVLASMLAVTGWAGAQVALWSIPRSVGGHPWFLATLCDAYWGFLTFYAWVVYKEPGWLARGLWLVAILLLGNMAMAAYALAVLFGVPRDAGMERVLLKGEPVPVLLPAGLVGGFVAVTTVLALR